VGGNVGGSDGVLAVQKVPATTLGELIESVDRLLFVEVVYLTGVPSRKHLAPKLAVLKNNSLFCSLSPFVFAASPLFYHFLVLCYTGQRPGDVGGLNGVCTLVVLKMPAMYRQERASLATNVT